MKPARASWLQRLIRRRSGDLPIGAAHSPDSLEFRLLRRIGMVGGPAIGMLRYRNDARNRDDILLVSINAKTGSVTVLKDISSDQATPARMDGAAGSDAA